MGKVIELFLMDNAMDGRILATCQTLPVSAIQVPRDRMSDRFEELDNPGIYVLLSEDKAYIGQASLRVSNKSFAQRWYEHVRSGRDWWDKAIAFVSNSADKFDATDLNWLESEMITKAKESGSYDIDNGNQPAMRITSRKRAVLEEVMDSIRFLLSVLNCPLLEKRKRKTGSAKPQAAVIPPGKTSIPDGTYTFRPRKKKTDGRTVKATAVVKNGEWTILKGSVLGIAEQEGVTPGAKEMRKKLKIDAQGNLLEDAALGKASPSFAGCVVLNQSCNGWTNWMDDTGESIDAYRN